MQTRGDNEWGDMQGLVDELKEEKKRDFVDVELFEKSDKDPPARGPHCEARIYLVENAKPMRQKSMKIGGERKEGMVQVAKEWIEDDKVQSCEGPWVQPVFLSRQRCLASGVGWWTCGTSTPNATRTAILYRG